MTNHPNEPFNIGYLDADVYDEMLPPHYYLGREDTDVVADLARTVLGAPRENSQLRVLDLGCGNGRITRVLAPYAGALMGTDKSAGMIDGFRAAFPDAEARCIDTESALSEFALAGRRFDVVGSFWSMSYPLLECFEDNTEDGVIVTNAVKDGVVRADVLLSALLEVIAPGGHLLMLFFDADSAEQRLVTRLWERVHPFPGTGRDYTWRLLRNALHNAELAGLGQLTMYRLPGVAVTANADAAVRWFRVGHLNSSPLLVDDPDVNAEIRAFVDHHTDSSGGRVLLPSGVHVVHFHALNDRSNHLPAGFGERHAESSPA